MLAHILRDTIQEVAPSLIHAQDAAVAATVAPMAKARGIPLVLTVHGPASKEAVARGAVSDGALVSYIKQLEQHAYRAASRIIAVDEGQAWIAREEFGVPDAKVRVILNAVPLERYPAALPTGRESYVLVPRRLVEKNGVHFAILAFARVSKQYPFLRLIVAGDGPLRLELQELAAREGVGDRVTFLGSVPHEQMATLLGGALAVIIPSVPVAGVVEASSIAALEAMASARPVIASDIGGLREIIKHEDTGFLVPPGNVELMATTILNLIQNPALARRVGERARKSLVGRLDLDTWFRRIVDVYYEALHDRTRRAFSND